MSRDRRLKMALRRYVDDAAKPFGQVDDRWLAQGLTLHNVPFHPHNEPALYDDGPDRGQLCEICVSWSLLRAAIEAPDLDVLDAPGGVA